MKSFSRRSVERKVKSQNRGQIPVFRINLHGYLDHFESQTLFRSSNGSHFLVLCAQAVVDYVTCNGTQETSHSPGSAAT